MKSLKIILVLVLLASCMNKVEKKENITATDFHSEIEEKEEQNSTFYIGTYTDGGSEGIYKYSLSKGGMLSKEKLVAKTENPSFLSFSVDKKYLIAVNELMEGTVSSFKILKDSLEFINKQSSGGMHPCFVVSNEDGFVLTANYSSGSVGLLKLKENGSLSELLDVHQHKGKGSNKRQSGPHAHSVWLKPTQNDVIEVDLGTNELWFSRLNSRTDKIEPKSNEKLAVVEGSGPRHMAFHPNGKWAYVFGELNNTITVFSMNEVGDFKIESIVSTLPKDFNGKNTGADVHMSSDGKFLYASNRGHNSIVIFKVKDDSNLEIIGYEFVRGEGPRNFSLSPDEKFLLVANQYTNNIISFKRNANNGLLTFVDEIKAPTPVCILF